MSEETQNDVWQRTPDYSGWWGADKRLAVMSGRMGDLPPQRSRVVRIFLSSTFTDTTVERNQLMQKVYPLLKKYCKEKYGLEFQVVDMRWGIRDTSRVDHSSAELCMREIKICQQVSVGPTFVTLLGQRYGKNLKMPRVNCTEFESISNCLKLEKVDTDLLDRWYKRDDNPIPSEFILQPIDETSDEEWTRVQDSLRNLMKQGASLCVRRGLLTEEQAEKYSRSVTHEEVVQGLLKARNPNTHCLCFAREIRNIDLNHKKAWRFIDIDDNGNVDKNIQDTLHRLKTDAIPAVLGDGNIHRFTIDWSDNDGINPTDHAEYLNEFCHVFEKAIKRLIDDAVAANQEEQQEETVFTEVLSHAHQSYQRCFKFHGRESILDCIRNYTTSNSTKAFVVHGNSGLGKTSIMAVTAKLIPEWIGENPDTLIVLRFLGTTPQTSTMILALYSVCKQIINVFNMETLFPKIPREFKDLIDTFKKIIQNIPEGKRLVLILDSLDQLPANSQRWAWIPQSLPKNVKLIVSILTGEMESGVFILNLPESQMVEVPQLKPDTAIEIISNWLKMAKRTISDDQINYLKNQLSNTKELSPLYIKLVFDRLVDWKSYSLQSSGQLDLPKTPITMITDLFKRLEAKHGELLVSHSLGYISACQKGISESELEDVLSLDDDVLGEVYQFHTPPLRRLPGVLWSRIRNDISEYVVEREANESIVLAWYHRQFREQCAARYYVTDPKSKSRLDTDRVRPLLTNLYDYFMDRWSGEVKKPFTFTEIQVKKLGLTDSHGEAERYVSAQPLMFDTLDASKSRYNERKLNELPRLALQMYHRDILSKDEMINSCYLDIEVLIGLITHLTFGVVMDDFHVYCGDQEQGEMCEISLVLVCMIMAGTSLFENPKMIPQNISGRLLLYYNALPDITRFIDAADSIGRRYCALVPPHMHLDTPGTDLMFTLDDHDGPVNDICMTEEHTSTMVSVSKTLVFFNGANSADSLTVSVKPKNMPDDDSFGCATGYEDLMAVSLRENPVFYVASKRLNGEFLHCIDCRPFTHGKNFSISGMHSNKVNDAVITCVWDTNQPFVLVFDIDEGSFIAELTCDENVVSVTSSEHSIAVLTADSSVSTFSFLGYPDRCETDLESKRKFPSDLGCITATHKNKSIFVVGYDSGNVVVYNIVKKKHILLQNTVGESVHHVYMHENSYIDGKHLDGRLVVCTAESVNLLSVPKEYYLNISAVEQVFSIKRKSTGAMVTCAGRALVVYWEGRFDAYGIRHHSNKAKHILTVDAHGRRINKVIGIPSDNIVMTSSDDGSVKMYEIQLSGEVRRKIPPIKRTNGIISGILPLNHLAVTWSSQSCTIDLWDLERGNILFSYDNPSDAMSITAAVICRIGDLKALCTLDAAGNLIFWQSLFDTEKKQKVVLILSGVADYGRGSYHLRASRDSDHVLLVSEKGDVAVVHTPNKEIIQSFRCTLSGNRGRILQAEVMSKGVLLVSNGIHLDSYLYMTGKRSKIQLNKGKFKTTSLSSELKFTRIGETDCVAVSYVTVLQFGTLQMEK